MMINDVVPADLLAAMEFLMTTSKRHRDWRVAVVLFTNGPIRPDGTHAIVPCFNYHPPENSPRFIIERFAASELLKLAEICTFTGEDVHYEFHRDDEGTKH